MVELSNQSGQKTADIEKLTAAKDIAGLIKALHADDMHTQSEAARALGSLGPAAMDVLLRDLKKKDKDHHLVIIKALSEIRDPTPVPVLIGMLNDENSEVRWGVAIALGEIGDSRAIEPLINSLRDYDKYVRYGAAVSLQVLGWKPPTDEEKAFFLAGLQDWQAVGVLGDSAIPALTTILHDRHSMIRIKAVEILGGLRSTRAIPVLMQSLADEDSDVRWAAVLASEKSGISMMRLPRGLSLRPKKKKNPFIAGFLNLILPGLGYAYLAKWWGVMIYEIDIFVTVWLLQTWGEFSFEALLPIYFVLALHAYYITVKMPEEAP
ncbi:MAG: HEAT repeat domain-containing protein [Methanoregula sp.]|nr:HEAT repeat domain-containing protein [Methanoregula sp.]